MFRVKNLLVVLFAIVISGITIASISNAAYEVDETNVKENLKEITILSQESISEKKNGIIYDNETDSYYLYNNDEIDKDFSGAYEQDGVTYLVENGKVSNYTGIKYIEGKNIYFGNGKADFTYVGLITVGNEQFYVEAGVITNTTNTTFIASDTAYIIEKSKVIYTLPTNSTAIIKLDGIWRYVLNSFVQYDFTGIAENEQGKWYFMDGTIQFDYTGLSCYMPEFDGFFYVENGKVSNVTGLVNVDGTTIYYFIDGIVNYGYTGLVTDKNGTWFVRNNILSFDVNTTYFLNDTAYIIENSRVVTTVPSDMTGIINLNGTWKYIINGAIQYDYTGLVSNKGEKWYVKNGILQSNYTGLSEYISEIDGYYYIEKGRIVDYTGLYNIDGIMVYFQNGITTYSYTGIIYDNTGTWFVQNSKVTKDVTLTYVVNKTAYIIENNKVITTIPVGTTGLINLNGIWRYFENSEVQYDYTGLASNSKDTYLMQNGKIADKYTGVYNYGTNGYHIINGKLQSDVTGVIKIGNIWYYIYNGVIDYSYIGIESNSNGNWYVNNGIITLKDTLVYKQNGKVYMIENSKVVLVMDEGTNALVQVNGVWRCVIDGEVKYDYNGVAANSNGLWIVENGKVTFKYTGVYKDPNKENVYYYAINSRVQTEITSVVFLNRVWTFVKDGKIDYTYTGIESNANGTWYVKNGIVTLTDNLTYKQDGKVYIIEGSRVIATIKEGVNTVVVINGVWRYVKDSEVQYKYNGLASNEDGLFVLENGKVTFGYNGIYQDPNNSEDYYYVVRSCVQTNYTGLVCVNKVWTYVKNGKVDYNYEGIVKNQNGTWYVKDGIISFKDNLTYRQNGNVYVIEESKVITTMPDGLTGVMQINGIWRYVKNSEVQFNYNGVASNENGLWVIEDGKVTFKYNGIYQDPNNSEDYYYVVRSCVQTNYTGLVYVNRVWTYISKGKVDYNYTGLATNENGTWYINKGVVDFQYNGTYGEYTIVNGKVVK